MASPLLKRLTIPVLTLAVIAGALRTVHGQQAAKSSAPSPEAVQFFEAKVRPVLVENCFSCHGEKKQRGGLRLDSRSAILEGGDQGPAVVPGEPEKSLLVKAIGHEDKDLKMPPNKKLAKEQVADLTRWVKLGAPWPGADKVA